MNTREHRQTVVHQELEEQIRKQAYYLWQQDGCRDGHDLAHWLEAKEMVKHRVEQPARVRLHHRERTPLPANRLVAVN
jgi:hypothetical protein